MYRVTYTSYASRLFSQNTLSTINAVSRRFNAKAGVSGLLVSHDGRFFQVLEGEEDTLTQLMGRIAVDQRHMGMQIVSHGPIERRAFVTWRLCCDGDHIPPWDAEVMSALQDLVPVNSDMRGRDPEVRQQVRAFLAQLRHLPTAAAS